MLQLLLVIVALPILLPSFFMGCVLLLLAGAACLAVATILFPICLLCLILVGARTEPWMFGLLIAELVALGVIAALPARSISQSKPVAPPVAALPEQSISQSKPVALPVAARKARGRSRTRNK